MRRAATLPHGSTHARKNDEDEIEEACRLLITNPEGSRADGVSKDGDALRCSPPFETPAFGGLLRVRPQGQNAVWRWNRKNRRSAWCRLLSLNLGSHAERGVSKDGDNRLAATRFWRTNPPRPMTRSEFFRCSRTADIAEVGVGEQLVERHDPFEPCPAGGCSAAPSRGSCGWPASAHTTTGPCRRFAPAPRPRCARTPAAPCADWRCGGRPVVWRLRTPWSGWSRPRDICRRSPASASSHA